MTVQITFVGLDRIGVSFCLALEDQKSNLIRYGFDSNSSIVKKVGNEAVFDKVFFHLKEAVHESDAVFLSLPVDQLENTLMEMAEEFKEGAIIINTSPANKYFYDLAKKLLPESIRYISMIPAGNGTCLNETQAESVFPRADLFSKADMLIPVDEQTHPDAVSLANEITTLVGAKACFTDPFEADGLLAKVDLLPKISTAALLLSTIRQPGWQESRRIAFSTFNKPASIINSIIGSEHPGAGILANRDNALLAIDEMVNSLGSIRAMVENNDLQKLDKVLLTLGEDYAEWFDRRIDGDWEKSATKKETKPPSLLGRLFGTNIKELKK